MRFRLGISLIQDRTLPVALRFAEFDFIKQALNALLTLPASETPTIYLFVPHLFKIDLLLSKSDKRIKVIRVLCDPYGHSTELQKIIDQNPCDIFFPFCYLPSFNLPGPLVSWIPSTDRAFNYLFYGNQAPHYLGYIQPYLAQHSDHLICFTPSSSEGFEANCDITFMPIVPYLSLTDRDISAEKTLNKYSINEDYIYLSSPLLPHKNIKTVLEAWNLLKLENNATLLVCNTHSHYRDLNYLHELLHYVKTNNLEKDILFLSHVSDAEDFHLLQQATATLFPSLCDTWNSQMEQAKIFGKPIWASAIPLHQQQGGDDALYFENPLNPISIANFITHAQQYLSKKSQREDSIETYETNLRDFARKLLLVFKTSLAHTPNSSRQLTVQLSSELYELKAGATMRADDIVNLQNKLGNHFKKMENLYEEIEKNKDIINMITKNIHTHHGNKLETFINQKELVTEFASSEKSTPSNSTTYGTLVRTKEDIATSPLHEEMLDLKSHYTGLLALYENVLQKQKEVINVSKNLLEELQEKSDELFYQQSKNTHQSLSLTIAIFFYERFKQLYRTIRSFFAPKLGKLCLHKPRLLTIPKDYYKFSNKKNSASLPSICIVTPSYQQGVYIKRTIDSVISQNYPRLEYVIQDGNSDDETVDIIKLYEPHLNHWESKNDEGQSNALNLGFAHTSGDIMAYLNSDDILLPGTLEYVGRYFAEHPEVDVVYGHRILIDEYDHEIGRWVLPPHEGEVLSWVDFVPQETLFWRRTLWDKTGGKIDESFRFAMDWDLLIRFRDAGGRFVRLPRFLGAFRVHQQQKTSAAISKIGFREMQLLRKRCHGRPVSNLEISKATKTYIYKHWLHHFLYKLGLLRY